MSQYCWVRENSVVDTTGWLGYQTVMLDGQYKANFSDEIQCS